MANKITFIVVDENTLGYVNPLQPNLMGILGSNKLGFSWLCGMIQLPQPNTRPAKRKDFDTFRVSSKGFDTDPAYDFPKK